MAHEKKVEPRWQIAIVLAIAALTAFVSTARADTLDDIRKSGVLNAAVFPDFPPFSSVDSSMALRGCDVDVAQVIAHNLKVKLNLVSVNGQNRIPMLTAHHVDLMLSVGYSAEREKVIDYVSAYAPYYVAVIGPQSIKVEGKADLANKAIAVNRGTLEDGLITSAAPPSANIERFDNYNSVIQAFLSGQTQLMVVGNDVGAQVLAKHVDLKPEQKFQLKSSPDHIGINKNERRLKDVLNQAIAKMLEDGTLNKISLKWLQRSLDPQSLEN